MISAPSYPHIFQGDSIFLTASEMSLHSSAIIPSISVAADDESAASFPMDSATTAKPFPCSPARAASMDAFNESRPVSKEISVIVFNIPKIFWDCWQLHKLFAQLILPIHRKKYRSARHSGIYVLLLHTALFDLAALYLSKTYYFILHEMFIYGNNI